MQREIKAMMGYSVRTKVSARLRPIFSGASLQRIMISGAAMRQNTTAAPTKGSPMP